MILWGAGYPLMRACCLFAAASLFLGCGRTAPGGSYHATDLGTTTRPPLNVAAPCSSNSDCGPTTATCFVSNLINDPQLPSTPGGYCSAACSSNADCGAKGICTNLGNGSWCLLSCTAPQECRAHY